jgi:glycosyltransferase involved in cell wall biosynthesis
VNNEIECTKRVMVCEYYNKLKCLFAILGGIMKKKIIFMVINMNVGGTEKALLNMILEMPKDKYDITVLMLEEYGGFLEYIPREVNVEYFNGYKKIKDILNQPPKATAFKLIKKGSFIKSLSFIFLYTLSKVTGEKSIFFKYILHGYPIVEKEYDIAVAYAGPMDFISFFVVNKIKAKKKIQWIHFDISKIGFDLKFATSIYKKFDKIFVVSNEGKSQLTKILPKFRHKIDNFINIISPEFVVRMAEEHRGFEDGFTGIRILTVGRLSKEKGQDLTIPILAKLKKEGYNVRWYCIGDGNAREEYENLIKKYNVEKDYILLGANPNPYPYMKHCDVYVQSSRHEGYCITLSEARCFNNPIITTNFTGAREQLSHDQAGIIINFDEDQMYNAISQLLIDIQWKKKIKKKIQFENLDTTRELEKLYEIAENI